jgi:hypothetical protein
MSPGTKSVLVFVLGRMEPGQAVWQGEGLSF